MDDSETRSQVEDVVHLRRNDIVGGRAEVFEPLYHFVGSLVDLCATMVVHSSIADVLRRKQRCLRHDE